MIQLRSELTHYGCHLTLMHKDKTAVLYKVTREFPNGRIGRWFELFRYRIAKADIYHDESYEQYPSNEAFGQWAWSCSSMGSVEKVLLKHFPHTYDGSRIKEICRETFTSYHE